MIETYQHIQRVQYYLNRVIEHLIRRAEVHDRSKLESPEAEIFEKYTPLLRNTAYGSEQYKQYLLEMKPALDIIMRIIRIIPNIIVGVVLFANFGLVRLSGYVHRRGLMRVEFDTVLDVVVMG